MGELRGRGACEPGRGRSLTQPFEPRPLLEALEAEQVEYIVIGGTAAVIRGASYVTFDLDITPARDVANLERLAAALTRLDAHVYGMPGDAANAFRLEGKTLANGSAWKFVTRYGELDIALDPDGTHGYEDLRRAASRTEVAGMSILVASLADVIRSKEAADRDKDRRVLDDLRRTLEQSRREP